MYQIHIEEVEEVFLVCTCKGKPNKIRSCPCIHECVQTMLGHGHEGIPYGELLTSTTYKVLKDVRCSLSVLHSAPEMECEDVIRITGLQLN